MKLNADKLASMVVQDSEIRETIKMIVYEELEKIRARDPDLYHRVIAHWTGS